MTRKEGTDTQGVDGLLMRQAGKRASGLRKEGRRRAGVGTLWAKKNPAGLNLRGVVNGLGLFSVTSEGRENEEEGE